MNHPGRPLKDAVVDEALGPIGVTVDRDAADRYLTRIGYRSSFFARGGPGGAMVPCGALGEAYTDLLDDRGYYFLNAVQARCEEEYSRPILVGEVLTCTGKIVAVGLTKSGLVSVDIEAEVEDVRGKSVFRSLNRLVVSPGEPAS